MRDSCDLKINLEEGYEWLDEIAVKLDTPGRTDLAYNALRGVLHVIREMMLLHEIFYFSDRLPLFIRGIFFEGYNPEEMPVMLYNKELLNGHRKRMGPRNYSYFENFLHQNQPEKIDAAEFLTRIGHKMGPELNGIDPEVALRAVIEVIHSRFSTSQKILLIKNVPASLVNNNLLMHLNEKNNKQSVLMISQ